MAKLEFDDSARNAHMEEKTNNLRTRNGRLQQSVKITHIDNGIMSVYGEWRDVPDESDTMPPAKND